jgi:hypothetical protein
MLVEPSMKVTLPVGVPAPGATAVMVSVKVTDWPGEEGLTDEVSVDFVEAGFTVSDSAVEELTAKLVSPPYEATMLWLPAPSVDVLKVATPPAPTVPVPSVVAPSMNVTEPDGLPAPGATGDTVAVKVTDWPNTDGLADEVSVVVVEAWLTTKVKVPLDPLRLALPP